MANNIRDTMPQPKTTVDLDIPTTAAERVQRQDVEMARRAFENAKADAFRNAIVVAVKRERESIIACIRSGSWSGCEEIVSMIRNRN